MKCPYILKGEACFGNKNGRCGQYHEPKSVYQIPCVKGMRFFGICLMNDCPFIHPTDEKFLEKEAIAKLEYKVLTTCSVLKVGDICLGQLDGFESTCGLTHAAPIKYCPIIAKGEGCLGDQCGLKHLQMKKDAIYCVNGLRKGIPCKLKVCIFRHPDDIIPDSDHLKK